jgi:hypothetical protein
VKKEQTHYQNTHIQIATNNQTKIKAEIVFGSPSMGCKGSGVCKVLSITAASTDWKCPRATAWISITKNSCVRMAFLKSSMMPRQINRYFRWHLFQVFESVSMPLFVEKRLRSIQEIVIQPGIYPVIDTDEFLIVEFKKK